MKIAIILYKTNTLANGEHPLMVRITQNKTRKYVAIGLSCPPSLWDFQKNLPRKNHPKKKFLEAIIAKKIATYHTKLLEMLAEDKMVSPGVLVAAVENSKTACQVFPFFDEIITRLTESGKIGNANVYKDVKNNLKQFAANAGLLFTDIDQRFLNKYETALRRRGLADTTLSYYFRTFKAVFNKAIAENLVKEKYYPFKQFKVSKFNTTTRKRAITKEAIKTLAQFPIEPSSHLYLPRQYFLFSYYGQGMNFRDMAFLKWSDIVENRVFYRRAKTGKLIQFELLAPAQDIIDFQRPQEPYDKENYIFPMLDKRIHRTPIQIDRELTKVLHRVNQNLKQLARLADIPINLTMYVARHTYATVLKWSGVAIPTISQAMGHSNTDITEVYLKSFANEVIDEANKHLL